MLHENTINKFELTSIDMHVHGMPERLRPVCFSKDTKAMLVRQYALAAVPKLDLETSNQAAVCAQVPTAPTSVSITA